MVFRRIELLSAGVFEKRVSNFIGNEQVRERSSDCATSPPVRARSRRRLRCWRSPIRDPRPGSPVNETELFVMTAILDNPEAFPNGAADIHRRSEARRSRSRRHTTSLPNADDPFVRVPDHAAHQQQGCEAARLRVRRVSTSSARAGSACRRTTPSCEATCSTSTMRRSEHQPVRAAGPVRFGQPGGDVREVRPVGATRLELAR